VVRCDNQWLSCRRILDPLQYAKQRKVIAAELLATGHHAVVCGVSSCVYRDRLVRNGGCAIPGTRIHDTHEPRKRPQPQSCEREKSAMAMQYPRHAFFDVTRSIHYRQAEVACRRLRTPQIRLWFTCPSAA
jgi:hypothetical protein